MRKFAAHYIFPISTSPIRKGIIKTDDKGRVHKVIDCGENFKEEAGLEFHNGIICPAFIPLSDSPLLIEFLKSVPELDKIPDLTLDDFQNSKSVFNKLKLIQLENDNIQLERLIQIFTLELARFLNSEKELGSISSGKKPGLIVVSGINYKNMKLTENCSIKRLI